jgi:RHS repeat-associated protein
MYRTHDQLGSPRDATDATGGVQARYEYDPFGRATAVVANVSDPLTFTGVLSHDASGLQLMTRRAYDPTLGRWVSEDPLSLTASTNLYQYVLNNTLKWVDPDGTVQISAPSGNLWPGQIPTGKMANAVWALT